jgi:hypothetical protein
MRRVYFTIGLIILFAATVTAQNLFVFEKTVLLSGIKAKKFPKDFVSWVEKQTVMEVVVNNKTDSVVSKAKFTFENPVSYPGSGTISRTYTQQTNGYIVCMVTIICKEDHLQVILSDFEHVPSAKGEVISFGKITMADNPSKFLMMDYDADWCSAVWKELKRKSEEVSSSFFLHLSGELANSR